IPTALIASTSAVIAGQAGGRCTATGAEPSPTIGCGAGEPVRARAAGTLAGVAAGAGDTTGAGTGTGPADRGPRGAVKPAEVGRMRR
ncbi:MAG TPA: hypothetical protein VML75_23980, partial [Kofleriaceae bacterium]|nr:hypothetical protein [Kofleriaceae bacterium]